MAADELGGLAAALSAMGIDAASLGSLPAPLVLHILSSLSAEDLASFEVGANAQLATLARSPSLWEPLCRAKWPGACRVQLYSGGWYEAFAKRAVLPPLLLTKLDNAAALCARLAAGGASDAAADGAELASTAWGQRMFLLNALHKAALPAAPGAPPPASAAAVAAWAANPTCAAFDADLVAALSTPAGAAAAAAFLDAVIADAQVFDGAVGGRGFHAFGEVPMRRSAAEFLLREPLARALLPHDVAAGLAARVCVLDAVIATAAAGAQNLSVAPPPALPAAHAAWWVFAA